MPKLNLDRTVAADIMSQNVIVLHPGDTYRHAVELLTQHRLTGLPVVDSTGKLLGVLSEKDILIKCPTLEPPDSDFLDAQIKFKKRSKSVGLSASLNKVGTILAGKTFRHLPVVDKQGVLKGIITRRDLIRILYFRIELSKQKIHEGEPQ